ncbi:fungal-specific transcription factor domain-containing protein [Mycena polygramma]|nr:fungal-specific transcription factor domain-containing protein [Mycena polygramma]
MTSNTEKEAIPPPKRRRLRGACDICRKQKGDSAEMPGNRCSNCIAFQIPRTAPEHITAILSGSNEYISSDPLVVYQILVAISQYARRLEEALATTAAAHSFSVEPSPPSASSASNEASDETDTESDDGVLIDSTLPESLRHITRDVSSNRFYGKSSSINFVKTVMDAKMEVTGNNTLVSLQRPEFWHARPWELTADMFVPQLFPEPQLMEALIDLYFSELNILIYIFHEITFRAAVASGLHLRDQTFGAVVLVVCAIGAKYSDDPRVFLEGANSEHSAGWKWFRQVRPVPTSFFVSPSLHDLQLICLSILYLGGSSMPEQCYVLVGVALRMALDVGAHRRIRTNHGQNVLEAELYKRVFWILLCSDTISSSLLGRPRAAPVEELDLDLPMVLEGEGPIVMAYGALLLNLMKIWWRLQDTIYPIKRKEQNYQEIVAELDSALNQWVDSVPPELRWDPNQPDLSLLNQSACIYVTYYVFQILLHRPFIPSPGNSSSISFPSLAICANAARSCGHVMDVQTKRAIGPLYNPQMPTSMFDAATVLLMNVFHRARPSADPSVQKCLDVLRVYERRWQIAGRNADIIAGILQMDGPLAIPQSLKRTRSFEDTTSIPETFEGPRDIAGSNRVAAVTQEIEQLQVSSQEIERLLFLPLHTEDLGRLPIYEPFDFDSIFRSDAFSPPAGLFAENEFSAPLVAPLSDSHSAVEPFETSWDWNTYMDRESN